MIKFNFNEKRKISEMIENNDVSCISVNRAMWNAAVYYAQINKMNKNDAFWSVVSFLNNNYSDFIYQGRVDNINKYVNKAVKYKIKDIETINITKQEMNKIISLNDIKKEKIAFVVLALAKYQNAASQRETDIFYAKTSEIFKFARVVIPSKNRDQYLRFAYEEGILKDNFSIGYNALTAAFVDHTNENDDIALILDEYDYLELAYAFLNYKNGGYKRCKECGRLFRVKQGHEHDWYCSIHKRNYESIREKEVECVECGKMFITLAKNNRGCRCAECQHIKQLEYQRKSMKKNRNVK